MNRFLFCTGIENSYPTIQLPNGEMTRVDEMEKCGHYERWREDFDRVLEMGLEYLRYGPPYYRTHLGPGNYDWSFSDETFNELKRLNIDPIVDLCHFGVPDWIGNFQNTEWPALFAEYARAFAVRYPWVRFYTPVNEIYVCATFSGQWGMWNERLLSDSAFVTALGNLCKATLLAERAILEIRPDARFVQSESSEYFHPEDPGAQEIAEIFNEKRFLSLDLCYGKDVSARMYQYLTDHGMSREDYAWFQKTGHTLRPHCIMGNDYYITNERLVSRTGRLSHAGEVFGFYVIARQYFDRYHLPVMHTETNLGDAEKAPGWLWKEWANAIRLKQDGVPIIGFTWYSLTDQVDWDTALCENNGRVNPLGLYDLNRKIRPVGVQYRRLILQWGQALPAERI
ncbi:MAG TPA: family 1 glycosylhydrolase, partial [Nitrosospira sp.]|nr:family 1 glycosylhydrolase [Nitrosospira sp.]